MKLIKINPDHYIIVDDSKIKVDDYFYNGKAVAKMCNQWLITFTAMDEIKCKKITHSTQPIEYSYNSISGGFNMKQVSSDIELVYDKIQQLSLSEVKKIISNTDVIKRKDEYLKKVKEEVKDYEQHDRIYILGSSDLAFTEGYNQALEDNKDRQYTEEDVLMLLQKTAYKYFNEGRGYKGNMAIAGDPLHGLRSELKEFIQSLQPTSWDVEFVDGKLKLL